MSTKVVNVKVKHLRPKYHNLQAWMEDRDNVYVGRGGVVFVDGRRFPSKASIWANPFKVGDDRDSCVELYRKYITSKIREEPEKYDLSVLRGKTLGCWCKPDACHGDVLVELVNADQHGADIDCEELIESEDEVIV